MIGVIIIGVVAAGLVVAACFCRGCREVKACTVDDAADADLELANRKNAGPVPAVLLEHPARNNRFSTAAGYPGVTEGNADVR